MSMGHTGAKMQRQAARAKGVDEGAGALKTRRFETIGRNVRIVQERDLAFPRIDHTNCMQVLAWTERQFRKAIDEAGS